MSQRFEETVVPAKTEKRLVERACDICQGKADRPGTGHWEAADTFAISRTTVSFEEGTSFPGDYNTETMSFDICPTCFKDKLVKFFAMFGAKPRNHESY
jgi:hypothetical protein